jgi:hypothetical protein
MMRRTKSSGLLPIVRLTNYFYPEASEKVNALGFRPPVVEIYDQRVAATGSRTPPPDYEQLYQSMQLDHADGDSERVRKKYACQGLPPLLLTYVGLKLVASSLAEDSSALSDKEVRFSRDLYINGVEYIIRGLPR